MPELDDPNQDPYESYDLSERCPSKTQAMLARLQAFDAGVKVDAAARRAAT